MLKKYSVMHVNIHARVCVFGGGSHVLVLAIF